MNGQPYNNSGTNSVNGTPTPSSTSYPASLSSHSSRDGSPARLPTAQNHTNSDKVITPNHYSHNYNPHIDPNTNSNPAKPLYQNHTDNYLSSPQVGNPGYFANQPVNNKSAYVGGPQVSTGLTSSQQVNNLGYGGTGQSIPGHLNSSTGYSTSHQTNSGYPLTQTSGGGYPVSSQSSQPGYPPSSQISGQGYIGGPVNSSPYSPAQSSASSTGYSGSTYAYQSSRGVASPGYAPAGVPRTGPTVTSPVSVGGSKTTGVTAPTRTDPLGGHKSYGTYLNQAYSNSNKDGQPRSAPAAAGGARSPGQTNYSYPGATTPQQAPTSGPPRTSALGIIPYNNEGVVSTPPTSTGSSYSDPYRQQSRMAQYSQDPVYQQYQQPPTQQHYQNSTGSYQQQPGYYGGDELSGPMSGLSVTQGYNRLWGKDSVDLLRNRDILPRGKVEPPPIRLNQEVLESANVSPELFRCTLTKIPETKSLLDKCRLPLGVLIHPFKDLNQLSVIQCSIIVRCRSCRTYINPFVYFVDTKHWKCNLCFRINDLPDEFQYDPLTKTYGDPTRRPEIKSATIEFIAPSEYMVRPPQPAVYVFVLDVSRLSVDSGYLAVFCETLLSQLEALPGDSRTAVGFITYDSSVHFYSLAESQSQPHQMVVVDIDDMFLPSPDNLLVNLNECLGLVRDLLKELPNKYRESYDTGSALGAALEAAHKLLAPTGGRVTVFQTCLPNTGPGKLTPREDPNQRSSEHVGAVLLNPITDFYKKIALECSGRQIAVDLFILNSQYVDLATLSGVSRFSGGCIYHFPLFQANNPQHVDSLQRTLQRYLCRKIGFESVMRLRCTRGLSIHTFHGNFFVRSTDLLSLPNINPDAGFGMQVSIDDNLTDVQNVCFQAALLYTSSKGERRIRVHTLCLPIAANLSDVLHGADQQCIIGLLAKMAVDRCHQSSLADAREAFINVVADVLSAYRITQTSSSPSALMVPYNLRLLPLYILALLKHIAFRTGQATRLDDRLFAMCQLKSLPLSQLMLLVYPDLYPVHDLHQYPEVPIGDEVVPQPPRLHLSAERIDSSGIYLMDDGETIIIYVGHNILPSTANALFGVQSFALLSAQVGSLPELETPESERLRRFINYLQNEKLVPPTVSVIRDDSQLRMKFLERLVEDKTEAGHSYYEFLQRVKLLVK